MNPWLVTLGVFLGILLRLAIPIGLTLLLGNYLRRLDQNWREDALEIQKELYSKIGKPQKCWEIQGCRPSVRSQCAAYLNPSMPCWEIYRQNGNLQTACQKCLVHKMGVAAQVPA